MTGGVPSGYDHTAPMLTEDDLVNGCVMGPHGYVYRPPVPSKQLTIEMQVSVTACRSWREVLATVENLGDLFDFRNTSTAVHRVEAGEQKLALGDQRFPRLLQLLRAKCKDLSAWGLSDASWGLAKMQCRDEEIFQRLSARAQDIVKDLDAQGLAIVAWSFATVARKDEPLLSLIAQEARKKLDTFGVQNISNLLWANATLGMRSDALHADLLRECLVRLDEFTTQELAIATGSTAIGSKWGELGLYQAWYPRCHGKSEMDGWEMSEREVLVGYVMLAYPVGDEWKAAVRSRVLRLKEYAPSELSMLAWALATRGDYDPDLLAYLARRSMELMRSFTGQNLATIIWAIATISYKDDPSIDEFLRMSLGAIIARSNEFQPLNIALISWGLAKLSFKAEAAFEAMCDAWRGKRDSAVQQIDSFVPQNLVQLMWACGTAGYRHETFLRAAARVAKRTIDQFSSQHQSNFLWACARLNFKEDVELLRVVAAAAQRKMHEGSPQHLSNIAWAASQLGPQHFQDCLYAVVSETSRRIAEFDPPSIMMLSDSLYEAKFNHGGEIMQVLRGQVQRMGNELFDLFTNGLPRPRGRGSQQELTEYQRRLRKVGLTTFGTSAEGYEHTTSLFEQLQLAEGLPWQITEAMAMPGWTTNARRTTVARRYALRVGSRNIEDPGTIFTSAFASAAEDNTADFIVVWLGQGKADSPSTGRAGRSGDAECRAMMATHEMLKKVVLEEGSDEVSGSVAFHTSGVPCLSCVGVAAQFKRHYPRIRFCFTFMNRPLSEREGVLDDAPAMEPSMFSMAPKTPRRNDSAAAPRNNGASQGSSVLIVAKEPIELQVELGTSTTLDTGKGGKGMLIETGGHKYWLSVSRELWRKKASGTKHWTVLDTSDTNFMT
ncbi:unnamed protein product [Cladocopium goreaui]|uniref:RNA-editing substrate-binding complex 6 protein domain-containing protein n=1 Tax=Cladocopium goreaui TaxID=2562237 RepID=A0A9P1CHQ6_9DINO|nr:unnamed protein product [Cladocopium goreaui]